MADITLVSLTFGPEVELQGGSPTTRRFWRFPPEVFERDPGRFAPMTVGLGPLSLAAALAANGYEAEVREFEIPGLVFTPHDLSRIVTFLADAPPVVGISCYGPHIPFVILAMKALSAAYPDKTFILGGHGPSNVARALVERYPFINVVAVGEGEELLPELLDAIRRGRPLSAVPGIHYRDGTCAVQTAPRPKPDLRRLPLPAYHLVPQRPYVTGYVMTSRGCPYRCGFCALVTLSRRVTFRTFDQVVEEARILGDRFEVDSIYFVDDTLMTNRARTIALCRHLMASGFTLPWTCFGRINLMTDGLMETMAAAGCNDIRYGVESFDDARLRALIKGEYTTSTAVDVLTRSTRHFKQVSANLIWGYPDETWEEFQKTIQEARRLFFELGCNVQLYLLQYPPGTPVHRRYASSLRLKPHLARDFPDWPEAREIVSVPAFGFSYLFAGTPEYDRKILALDQFEQDVLGEGFTSITGSMLIRKAMLDGIAVRSEQQPAGVTLEGKGVS